MQRAVRSWKLWAIVAATLTIGGTLVSLMVLASQGEEFTATPYADVIRFEAQGVASLQVQIFDLSGRRLWDSGVVSGRVVDWNRANEWGERLAYGAYLYQATGWSAQGTLVFQKSGKLALLPGDKVQLQQAPSLTPPESPISPPLDTLMTLQPMAYHYTDLYVSNRLGVGTDSPLTQLHVVGDFYSTGKIGLGLSSPYYYFEVSKNIAGLLPGFRMINSNPTGFVATATKAGATQLSLIAYGESHSSFPRYAAVVGESTVSVLRVGTLGSDSRLEFVTGGWNIRMAISSAGNIGIGTTSPVTGSSVTIAATPVGVGEGIFTTSQALHDLRATDGDLDLEGSGGITFATGSGYATAGIIDTSQRWGLGTGSPAAKLHVYSGAPNLPSWIAPITGAALRADHSGIAIAGHSNSATAVLGFSGSWYGGYFASDSYTPILGIGNYGDWLIELWEYFSTGSNRRFAVSRSGTVYADGAYTGPADFAELLPIVGTVADYEEGDVLAIGPDGRIQLSSKPYDSAVAGVYSTRPGFLGDQRIAEGGIEAGTVPDDTLAPVALIGVVRVKTSAEAGPIQPGDLLVTAATPGHAMRCDAGSARVGTVIGKALEPLTQGTGLIKVLVTLR